MVSACANGLPDDDRDESEALASVLGDARPPILAVKANLGEMMDASGLLQALAAACALRSRQAPPIAGQEELRDGSVHRSRGTTALRSGSALVTAINDWGTAAALVLSVAP